jgi:hypothetical protein
MVTIVDFGWLRGRKAKSHVNADVKITIRTGAVRIAIPPLKPKPKCHVTHTHREILGHTQLSRLVSDR